MTCVDVDVPIRIDYVYCRYMLFTVRSNTERASLCAQPSFEFFVMVIRNAQFEFRNVRILDVIVSSQRQLKRSF